MIDDRPSRCRAGPPAGRAQKPHHTLLEQQLTQAQEDLERATPAVQPVLAGRATVTQLFRLWGLVLVANLVGSALFAAFASTLGPALGVIDRSTLGEMARPLIEKAATVTFFSAVGAGWLMGLLAWLIIGARDPISQIAIVWFCTFLIGLAQLHHSIAGSIEVLMSVFAGAGAGLPDFAHFLLWSVLGNVVGGCLFVGVLKYQSVRQA